MKGKGQRYLWWGSVLLIAIATHFALRWSLIGLSTFILAYGTKGIRRSPSFSNQGRELPSKPRF